MPANGTTVRRAQYPLEGWSSWFGGFDGTPYPSARPYGAILQAIGSTGIFDPFNKGVKYIINETTSVATGKLSSTFSPPISIVFAFIQLNFGGTAVTKFYIVYYRELGVPTFEYSQTTVAFWANTRKPIFLPGPGPPPFPLLSKIGPIVKITPFNRRGYEMID